MKISMWILADWLKKYTPILYITEGAQTLRGVRLFSNDINIDRQNVYLGKAKDFIPSGGNEVICVQGNDMILLETDDIEAVLNDIFAAFDFYNRWSDRVKEAIYEGCSLQFIVDESYIVIEEPLIVYDSGYIVMAFSSQYPQGSIDNEWDNLILTKSNSLEKMHNISEYLYENRFIHYVQIAEFCEFSCRSMWRNIFLQQRNMGFVLILEVENTFTEGKMQILDTLGNLVESWIRLNQERKEMRGNTAIFCDLLEGRQVLKEDIIQRLETVNWKPNEHIIVINIANSQSHNEVSKPLFTILEQTLKGCYLLEFKSSIIIIANLVITPITLLLELLTPMVMKSHSYCGISYEFTDIMLLPTQYEQSVLAIKHCAKESGGIYFCKDYALDYIYSVIRTNVSINIVHPALLMIQKHDKYNNCELFETLYQYLINERNLVKTAGVLCIHRNSLLYRLNKIKQLTNIDLDNKDIREYLFLSYKIFMKLES